MQTTLLTIAIALILALVTALVGPLFFPFSDYRTTFEAEASRLVGLPVRILGPIDARLLPTPILTLQGVEIGPPESEQKISLRAMKVEFELGPLVRGEFRAAELHLDTPKVAVGLDKTGRLAWMPGDVKIDPDALSFEKVVVENASITLTDGASGARLALEDFWFKGDLRSLAGPLKGDGGFKVGNLVYPYSINVGRLGDDGASRFRIAIVPIEADRMRISADGALSLTRGAPQVEGTITAHRPVVGDTEGGKLVLRQPWQLVSKIKGDSAGAVLEQIEYTYGPEDRAMRLKGDARITFGAEPRLKGVLSSPQIDLDRVLGLPENLRRKPIAAIKTLASSFSYGQRLPIPVEIGISTEAVTLAGATLARMSGDLRSDGEIFDVEQLEFRAPGLTQVRLSGRLTGATAGASFNGPVRIEAADPRAFLAWLSDRSDLPPSGAEPLRLSGELALSSEAMAIDRLKAELDRVTLEGRAAYRWPIDNKPARLDADLRAPDIDIDRAVSIGSAAFSDLGFDWPREGSLAIEIGRATLAGIQARNASVKMWLEANGLMIERLAIADFGGAALTGSGRLDTGLAPRGTVTFELDARRLDGTIALIDRISPRAAEWLRRAPGTGAKLQTTLSVDDGPTSLEGNVLRRGVVTRFTVDGRVGELKLALAGGASGLGNVFGDVTAGGAANVRLDAKIDAEDSNNIVAFLSLGQVIAAEKRPGQLRFALNGPLNGDLRIDGQLTGPGLDVKGDGTARLSQGIRMALALDAASVDLRPLRRAAASTPLPAKLKLNAQLANEAISLEGIDGTIGGIPVRGKLALAFEQATRLDGELDVGVIDVPALIGVAIGMPQQSGAATWPAEPFRGGLFGDLTGRIALRGSQVIVTPKLAGLAARGTLRFNANDVSFENLEATLAGGQLTGQLGLHRAASGLNASGRIAVAGAEVSSLLPGAPFAPVTGKVSIDVAVEGAGLSPAALIGSLTGGGTYRFDGGTVTGLNARVFDLVVRAVDQGLAIDAVRVGDRADRALATGKLTLPRLDGSMTFANGQIRIGAATTSADGVDLSVNGGINLTSAAFDGRVALAPSDAPGSARPQVVLNFKGKFDAPERSLDVSALTSALALRAVEQQAKKLQDLQNRRIEPPAESQASAPFGAPVPSQMAPAMTPGLAASAPVMPPVPYVQNVPGMPSMPLVMPPTLQPSLQPTGPAAVQGLPPLPPPIDVRPAPAPRAESNAPRVDTIAR